MRLYILRHGDPDYSIDNLTATGRREAELLAGYLAGEGIDAIFSSPKGRARATAACTAERLGLPVQIEEWTRELQMRLLSNERMAAWNVPGPQVCNPEYLRSPQNYSLVPDVPLPAMLDAEAEIRRGSDAFLARLGYVRDGGHYRVGSVVRRRVAVFCHGGFGVSWLGVLLNIPMPLAWAGFFMHTSSVTQILMDERPAGLATPRCLMFGALPHIYHAGVAVNPAGLVGDDSGGAKA